LLDEQEQELERQIKNSQATIQDLYVTYQTQFRVTNLTCSSAGIPIPASMLEKHKNHTATISQRKLTLAENALQLAQTTMTRLELQLAKDTLNGPRNALIADDVHTPTFSCTCVTMRLTQSYLHAMMLIR
jgi:hypothetical protein